MRIVDNFKNICGISDDNILKLDVKSGNKSRVGFISFPDLIKGAWISSFSITISQDIILNNIKKTEEILTFSPELIFENISSGTNIKQQLTYRFYTMMLSSNSFSDVVLSPEIDKVSFLVDRSLSIKIVCDDPVVLESLIISAETTTTGNERVGNFGDFVSDNFRGIDLVISSKDFNTVLRKTYLEGKDEEVTFNIRGLFGNMCLANKIQTKPLITTQFITEDIINSEEAIVSSKNLGEILWLPGNPNELYNFDYSDYYVTDGSRLQKFLTLAPKTKYKKGSLFSLSYLLPNDNPESCKLKVVYKNWSGQVLSSTTISYLQLKDIVQGFGFADYFNKRLDFYISLPDNNTRFMEFSLYDGNRVISETKNIELYESCKHYDTIFFLNKIGGIDAVERFDGKEREKTVEDSNVFYGVNKGKRNTSYRLSKTTTTFSTELLNTDECEWMFDLAQSYFVFKVDVVNKEMKNVIIDKVEDFSYMQGDNGKIFKITIDE